MFCANCGPDAYGREAATFGQTELCQAESCPYWDRRNSLEFGWPRTEEPEISY